MRILKMLAYALLGYAIYEFVRGVVEEPATKPPVDGSRASSAPRPRHGNSSGKSARGAAAAS